MVEEINEIAIIFKRVKEDEYASVVEFIPFKVVEGYFCEEEGCFIDTEQNVYAHMASLSEIGNVYAGRRNLYDTIKVNPNRNIYRIRKLLLEGASKFEYYKDIDEDSDEYNIIKMRDKETGELITFSDKDTAMIYAMYKELPPEDYPVQHNNTITNVVKSVPETEKQNPIDNYTRPIEIVEDVKKTIKGQDEAVETIVTLLWLKYKYPNIKKSNILLIGPTGVGKTAIFEKLQKLLNVPLAIYGIPGTSQAGYKGHDIDEMLVQLYYAANCDLKKAEQEGIVIIDEFDKLSNNNELGELTTTGVQNELLKLIEGCQKEIDLGSHNSLFIDTSNITFVCCGAFEEMYKKYTKNKTDIGFCSKTVKIEIDDLEITPEMIAKEGIRNELVGRLPIILKLHDLNKRLDILEDILVNSDGSLLISYTNSLKEERGIEVEGLDNLIGSIVQDASERKVGARGLDRPVRVIFDKAIYKIDNNPGKYNKLVFGSNILKDNNDFELVETDTKKRVKKVETVVE